MNTQTHISLKKCRKILASVPLAWFLTQPIPVSARTLANGISTGTTSQGAKFMSGGVGLGERQKMLGMAPDYDLKLSFANRRGHYLSDVNVSVTDEDGKQVLNTVTAGPWLYVSLPPGKYDVKATYDHRTEEIKDLQVSHGYLATRLMHWNIADQQLSQK